MCRRTGFAGKKQAAINRSCQLYACIRLAGTRIRIGPACERIGAPAVDMNRLYPSGERCAKQAGQLRSCEIKKGMLAGGLESGGEGPAKKHLDKRAPERPQMVGGSPGPIDRSEEAAVFFEFIRTLKREK